MLKPLFACAAIATLPFSAQASTDLARQWGLEASRLSAQTTEMILTVDQGQSLEISGTYALDVYRFARTSVELARWVDTAERSRTMSCIFRGMAAESEDQLMVLELPSGAKEQRESLSRLASMFSDAERVAVAAQRPVSSIRVQTAKPSSACTEQYGSQSAALN